MKILFVSAYGSNDRGAYTRRLLNLKEGLQQCGVVTDILYLGDSFSRYPIPLKALDIPMIKQKLEDYDAIHGGSNSACYVLGLMKNLQNFTLFYDVHGCVEEALLTNSNSIISYLLYLHTFVREEVSIRRSDFFITCSKPLMNRLVNRGINQCAVRVIRNGVDTDLFKPRDFSKSEKEFIVTYAGVFQPYQGIENLLAAIELVKEPHITFKIIGFGKGDNALKNRLSKMLACRAELMDSMNQDKLVDQLCSSDILIIPRSRNCVTQLAFPTKFAEYIATGKPVIVTNVDETANFVREFNCGFICDPSAESIAKTIIRAASLSPSILAKMGNNGRHLAESRFDRRIIAKIYYQFLHDVLHNS